MCHEYDIYEEFEDTTEVIRIRIMFKIRARFPPEWHFTHMCKTLA